MEADDVSAHSFISTLLECIYFLNQVCVIHPLRKIQVPAKDLLMLSGIHVGLIHVGLKLRGGSVAGREILYVLQILPVRCIKRPRYIFPQTLSSLLAGLIESTMTNFMIQERTDCAWIVLEKR